MENSIHAAKSQGSDQLILAGSRALVRLTINLGTDTSRQVPCLEISFQASSPEIENSSFQNKLLEGACF